jgi:hypothetical protein
MSGSNYAADPVTGVALRPGAESWSTNEGAAWSKINSSGYRDRERSAAKPAGVLRLAVLGDSITEARQVAQDAIFTRLMERDLEACGALRGGRIEVLNFAVPGFGAAQEYLTLRERVWAYRPDLVALVFYSPNDIFDNHRELRALDVERSPYFTLERGKLTLDDSYRASRQYQPVYRSLKNALSDALNSSLLALTIYEARQRLESLHIRRAAARTESAAPGGDPPPDFASWWFYDEPRHRAFVEAWKVTEALLGAIAEEAGDHGAPFLLIGVPSAEQLHPDERVREHIRRQRGLESLDYPERRLDAWARRAGVAFLDAGPPLRAYAVREQAYLNGFANTALGTGHLNERGHRVASRLFSESVCRTLSSKGQDARFRSARLEAPGL